VQYEFREFRGVRRSRTPGFYRGHERQDTFSGLGVLDPRTSTAREVRKVTGMYS